MGTQGFKYHGPFSGAIMASLITLVVMFAVAVVIFRAIAYLACLLVLSASTETPDEV